MSRQPEILSCSNQYLFYEPIRTSSRKWIRTNRFTETVRFLLRGVPDSGHPETATSSKGVSSEIGEHSIRKDFGFG
ncbi:hypothetical protein CEXT_747691 [Caerostris extrusa]|uniref:Ycf15 n=1 Tax=Caerostris extrusa TaxID=172846 RepID=A0AAV4T7M6_CAEEX|nr:hypothetical protein CEXT_747691 [Caerostris extrusa]